MKIDYKYGAGSINIPMGTPTLACAGVNLHAYRLTVYDWADTGTLVINGNSTLDLSSYLNLQGQGTGSLPPGPLVNNGTMTMSDSTLRVGALGGKGKIFANRSTIDACSAPTSETIVMRSSYLDIGGDANDPNPGMRFLAPVAGFDASSTINLEETHATMEVYFKASGALFLFDGPTMVANMHVSGSPTSPTVYATQNTPAFGAPSVTLSATNPWGHAMPMTVVG
jgi:hypothetical protein